MNITTTPCTQFFLKIIALLLVSFFPFFNGLVQASGVITIDASPFDYPSTGGTQGFKFTVNNNMTIDALGIYDAGYDGLIQPGNVGLWLADGTLLVNAVVPGGAVGEPDGQFRFTSVTPTQLNTGVEYVIGAFSDGETFSSISNDPSYTTFGGVGSIDPRVNLLEDRYSGTANNSFVFPTLTDFPGIPAYGWIGPNFRVAVVPLPAAGWLFGAALVGFVINGHKRKV